MEPSWVLLGFLYFRWSIGVTTSGPTWLRFLRLRGHNTPPLHSIDMNDDPKLLKPLSHWKTNCKKQEAKRSTRIIFQISKQTMKAIEALFNYTFLICEDVGGQRMLLSCLSTVPLVYTFIVPFGTPIWSHTKSCCKPRPPKAPASWPLLRVSPHHLLQQAQEGPNAWHVLPAFQHHLHCQLGALCVGDPNVWPLLPASPLASSLP